MHTNDSQDYRREERAIFHRHIQITGLQWKGDGHIPQTLTSHRTSRERKGPSFTNTDKSQDYKGRESAIFHGHRRVRGLQEKGGGYLPRTQTSDRTTEEGSGPYYIDTDDSQDSRGRERAIFHEYRRVTLLQGKGGGHLARTQASHRTIGEGSGSYSTGTYDSQGYK